jgi:hypothetical protein
MPDPAVSGPPLARAVVPVPMGGCAGRRYRLGRRLYLALNTQIEVGRQMSRYPGHVEDT